MDQRQFKVFCSILNDIRGGIDAIGERVYEQTSPNKNSEAYHANKDAIKSERYGIYN